MLEGCGGKLQCESWRKNKIPKKDRERAGEIKIAHD